MEPPAISEPWYLIHKKYQENEAPWGNLSLNSIDEMKLDTRIMEVLDNFGKDLWINIRGKTNPAPRAPQVRNIRQSFGNYPDDIYFHVRRTESNDFIRAFEIVSVWIRTAPWMPMKNESGWKVIHYEKESPRSWKPESIPEDQQLAYASKMWQPLTSEWVSIWKDTGLLKDDGETLRNIWIPLSWLDISSFLYREYIRIEGAVVNNIATLRPSKSVEIRVLPYLWGGTSFQAAINRVVI